MSEGTGAQQRIDPDYVIRVRGVNEDLLGAVTYRVSSPPSKFIFGDGYGDWLIEITATGIKFNHDKYPDIATDGFARAFCDILEKKYIVKFEKR